MSEEIKTEAEQQTEPGDVGPQAEEAGAKVGEAGTGSEAQTGGPQASWEQREGFRINGYMQEIIKTTIAACEVQTNIYRRKLEKLQYGS